MPKLTAAAVRKYTAGASRREIPDALAPGLHLVVQPKPGGSKSWALRFRRPDGRPAKMTLGPVDLAERETHDEPVIGAPLTLGQARELAAQIDRKRKRGIDVIEEHKAARARKTATAADLAANTFGACLREFFIHYRTKRKTRPRRWWETAGALGLRYKRDVDPTTVEPEVIKGGVAAIWADRPVALIDGHDVHTVVSEAHKLGNENRARKLHAALSIVFSWLLRERRVTANPCVGVWRPGPPPPRERVLTDAEIVAFWQACDRFGPPYGALFKLLLLTGCRLREAAHMTRGEIVGSVWTIPGGRTKNHRALTLPLPPMALELIGSVPAIGKGDYVFSYDGVRPLNDFSYTKKALDAAMAEIAGRALPEFRLHDLRRTFASGLAALGIALPVIEKLLNHVSGSFGGIVGVYQKHEYAAEKAEALQRWAAHVAGLILGKPPNVTELRRA